MKRARKILYPVLACVVVALVAYAGVLYHPSILFAHSLEKHGYTLWTDTPFVRAEAEQVLDRVELKMRQSPFYRPGERYDVCISSAPWRRALLFAARPKAGGLHYYGASSVLLSGADLKQNRLIAPSGKVVEDERSLDYFIAHELTHAACEAEVGIFRYHRIPDWIKEGYADYVGRGSVLGRKDCQVSYLREAAEMNWPAQAPYLRYNLLVAYMLEKENWTPMRLHLQPLAQPDAELIVRSGLSSEADRNGVLQPAWAAYIRHASAP